MFFAGIYHSLEAVFVFPGLRVETNGTQERERKKKTRSNPTVVVITPYFLTRCSQMSLDNFSPQHAKKVTQVTTHSGEK